MARRTWPLLLLGLLLGGAAGGATGWLLRGDAAGPSGLPDDRADASDEGALRRRIDDLVRENQDLRRRTEATRARRRAEDGAPVAPGGKSGPGAAPGDGPRGRARAAPPAGATAEEPVTINVPEGAALADLPLVAGGGIRFRVEPPPVPVNVPEDAKAIIEALRAALEKGNRPLAQALEMALVLKGKAAIDPLLGVIRDPQSPPALAQHALDVLSNLDAPGLASVAEELARRPGTPESVRDAALGTAVASDPAGALSVVQRLLASSDPADVARARQALSRANDKSYLPLLSEEIRRTDRTAHAEGLAGAIARLKDKPWSAFQMTDAPDTPMTGDLGTAWASKSAEMGLVQLELDYAEAVVPDTVRIRETLAAGAVVKIESKAAGSNWETLWEGAAAAAEAPRWFEPPLGSASRATRTIRITLDTDRVQGWNEIDAVELVGGGRRQWATAARASSSYAD